MNFIASYLRVKIEKLSPETDLLSDLGVDGADAIEFIESFAQEFDVDFSSLEYDKYFGPEAGFNPLLFLFYPSKVLPFRIKYLIRAAISKEWLE
jgi:acyl carrier protein